LKNIVVIQIIYAIEIDLQVKAGVQVLTKDHKENNIKSLKEYILKAEIKK
jgi:hypothetical protein